MVGEVTFYYWASVMNNHPRSLFKLTYLVQELLVLAWSASVQRAKPYNCKIPAKDRPSASEFRQQLMAFVEEHLLPHYRSGCTEEQHLANLQRLSAHGSQLGGTLFDQNGYRIGVAQKFLNLLLKSMWALGLIPAPPHCPVDRVIIQRASRTLTLNWTAMTTIDEYRGAIDVLKAKAALHQLTLAEWEMRAYARRDPLRLDIAAWLDDDREPQAN